MATVTWDQVRSAALAENLELRLARQLVVSARADLERAGLRPNPTLTLSDTSWKYGQSPLGRASDLMARIDQSFERGGKRELRETQGRAVLEATLFDALRTERAVLTRVATALIDLDNARVRRNAARDIARSIERSEAIALQRLRAGDLSEVSAGRVSAEASRARNDTTQIENEINEMMPTLRLLLGAGFATALETATIDLASLPGGSVPDGPAPIELAGSDDSGFERSADAAAVRQRELAARSALDLARAQRTRDISIGLQMERMPFTQSTALGVSASVPLFVFNDYSADIRRADSDIEGARLETQRQALQWQSERLRLRQALTNAQERERRLSNEALPYARRNAETVEFSFRRGGASVLEVLDAQRVLRATQIDELNARADRLRARAALALLDDTRYQTQPNATAESSLP